MSIRNHLSNNRKSTICCMITSTKKEFVGADNVDSRLSLEKVISYVNSTTYVSRKQYKKVTEFICKIQNQENITKETVRKECNNMISVLNDTYIEPTGRESAMEALDEKIDQVYGKLNNNNKRISELRKAQANVLGKDKNLWKKYQSEINRRNSENRIYEQSYDTLLKKKESLGIVNEVEKTKAVNDVITSGDMFVDVDKATEIMNENEVTSQDITAENNKIQECVFGSTSDSLDDDYNAALEAAALNALEGGYVKKESYEEINKITESK